jgi:hypothetical protein
MATDADLNRELDRLGGMTGEDLTHLKRGQVDEPDGIYGIVGPETRDRVFEGFFSVVSTVFKYLTPTEIAAELEQLSLGDMHDTFTAISQLPEFQKWLDANWNKLIELRSAKV